MDIRQFSYPGTANPALHDIHLLIPEGTTLGIVGPTGSGKTTLLRLILRQYLVTEGAIVLDEATLTQYTSAALGEVFAYVPQDPFMFSMSIRDNIALGSPDASVEAVAHVAERACVHDEILRFPNGYGTLVGEHGVTLSGGQKQRIAIARALLRDAPILLLDDALSAVDAQTAARLTQALRAYWSGRSAIMVSHRLAAVRHCDAIAVISGGRVSQYGSHAQLVAQPGWYADVYHCQSLAGAIEQGG